MSSTRSTEHFVVYGLRETYHQLGEYEFKIVLHPKKFKNSHLCDLSLVDSDGKQIRCELKKWGRKMNCSFVIDSTVSDGISQVKVFLKEEGKPDLVGNLTFWVIK